MIRKIFRPPKYTPWKILEKEAVDEIIFKEPNPRNRVLLELMSRGGVWRLDIVAKDDLPPALVAGRGKMYHKLFALLAGERSNCCSVFRATLGVDFHIQESVMNKRSFLFTKWLSVSARVVWISLLLQWSLLGPGAAKEIDLEKRRLNPSDMKTVKTYYVDNPENNVRQVMAIAMIDAPIDTVWPTIVDFHNLGKGSTRLKVKKVTEMENHQTQVDLVLDLPWPLQDMSCLLVFSDDEKKHEMKWHNLGGCVRKNKGRISLKKEGDRTLMEFCVALELGNILPQWLVNWVLKQELPDEINLIRKAVKNREDRIVGKTRFP